MVVVKSNSSELDLVFNGEVWFDAQSRSLTNIIRTRSTRCPFASGFISIFDGRQPIGIIQFCLTPKSTPVESKIFE